MASRDCRRVAVLLGHNQEPATVDGQLPSHRSNAAGRVEQRQRAGKGLDRLDPQGRPDEILQTHDYVAATQHLVTELWKYLRENPGEISWTVLEGISPELRTPRTGWL